MWPKRVLAGEQTDQSAARGGAHASCQTGLSWAYTVSGFNHTESARWVKHRVFTGLKRAEAQQEARREVSFL